MKRLIFLFIFSFSITSLFAFKVVGYLPAYRFYAVNSIDYTKITHLMVSFANPDVTTDEFVFSESLTGVVAKAHQANCEVFISIGGGGLSTVLEDYYKDNTASDKRPQLIHSLMNFVRTNDFDGIDVDLEGSLVQMSTYDDFVLELIDSAKVAGFEVSAALARWTGGSVSQAVVEGFDFLNLMSYDLTGPWSPNNPGQHSPMSQAEGDFSYWNQKGAQKSNIIIGLPFYGYEFKTNKAEAWTWCNIVNMYPDSLNQDHIVTTEGDLYFNGISTIEEKVQCAIDNIAGGVMIWELGQDCFTTNSMLDVIDQKLRSNNIILGRNDITKKLNLYPNPTSSYVHVDGFNGQIFIVLDLAGKVVLQNFVRQGVVDLSDLKRGVYSFVLIDGVTQRVSKVVKK